MIQTLYVSKTGSNYWNGLTPEPNTDGTDGPLATLDGARQRVRRMREQNMTSGVVTIMVQPGFYGLPNTLCFEPMDRDIIFEADGGEVIIDGSVEVDGFIEATVNGKLCWVADIQHLLAGRRTPRTLFSDGQRRPRSRFPKKGQLEIESVPDHKGDPTLFQGSASRFIVAEGDFDPNWRNIEDIEAVVNHLWVEERMPVTGYEAEKRRVTSSHRSVFTLKNLGWMGDTPCAKYHWENVFEAMTEPGEWYLDAKEEKLYYLPKEGESIAGTKIRLTRHCQLVRFHGDLDKGQKVENVHFEGITFQNTDWMTSEGWGKWWDPQTPAHTWRNRDSYKHFDGSFGDEGLPPTDKFAAVPQAAHNLPGALSFESANNCSVQECSFKGLGFYAIDVRFACSHLRFQGNTFTDIGAGGIKIDGAVIKADHRMRTHRTYVGDNKMIHLGQVFPSSVGVCICHSDNNVVEHNEISHLYYTAISVGWVWLYDENPSYNNTIQYNYLHNVGLERLSDMGGIYTIGVQQGTVIRGNHVHDVKGAHYGGWGIYLDEGSSLIRVEKNIVHHTKSQSLHEHWGRGNIICDNVFALSKRESVVLSSEERANFVQSPAKGVLLMNNVFLTNGNCVFSDKSAFFEAHGHIRSDVNLFWDIDSGQPSDYVNQSPHPIMKSKITRVMSLDQAREEGLELHSRAEDPLFVAPEEGDFSLQDGSPIHKMGIQILDTSICGPREKDMRITRCDPSCRTDSGFTFSD